jgi:hypothetical protein
MNIFDISREMLLLQPPKKSGRPCKRTACLVSDPDGEPVRSTKKKKGSYIGNKIFTNARGVCNVFAVDTAGLFTAVVITPGSSGPPVNFTLTEQEVIQGIEAFNGNHWVVDGRGGEGEGEGEKEREGEGDGEEEREGEGEVESSMESSS